MSNRGVVESLTTVRVAKWLPLLPALGRYRTRTSADPFGAIVNARGWPAASRNVVAFRPAIARSVTRIVLEPVLVSVAAREGVVARARC